MPRRPVLAPALLAACFTGDALEGEPCQADGDCGPELSCSVGGLCGEVVCGESQEIALDNFDPDIFLVVDYAQTMDEPIGELGMTRWEATRALVQRIADTFGDRANLGIQVVPTVDPTADTVPDPCLTSAFTGVPPAADAAEAVLAALYVNTTKNGEHALSRGLEYARKFLTARLTAGPRPQAIVLISDGPFNCPLELPKGTPQIVTFDALLAQRAADLAAIDIPVFVVGIDVDQAAGGVPPGPGLEWKEVDKHLAFVQLAESGGRARAGTTTYYTHADGDALIAALEDIPDAFADCRVELARVPQEPARLAVTVDGLTYKQGDCADDLGWRWVDDTHTHIELCEATCEALRSTRALTVDPRCADA